MKLRPSFQVENFDVRKPDEYKAKRADHDPNDPNRIALTIAERFGPNQPWPLAHPRLSGFTAGEKIDWTFPQDLKHTDGAFLKRKQGIAVVEDMNKRWSKRRAVEQQTQAQHDESVWTTERARQRWRFDAMLVNRLAQDILIRASRMQAMDGSNFVAEFLMHRARQSSEDFRNMLQEAGGMNSHGIPIEPKAPINGTGATLEESLTQMMLTRQGQVTRSLWEVQHIMAAHALAAFSMIGFNTPGNIPVADDKQTPNTDSKVSSLANGITKKAG